MIKIGDYVVGTKYSDGDPSDHFCVGTYAGTTSHDPPRHIITDNEGLPFRKNGFRRVKKISQSVGSMIVENIVNIERSGISVWKWVNEFENMVP